MLPQDKKRRANLLASVYDVAVADGPLDAEQKKRFDRVRKAFGLEKAEIGALPSLSDSNAA